MKTEIINGQASAWGGQAVGRVLTAVLQCRSCGSQKPEVLIDDEVGGLKKGRSDFCHDFVRD
jgi:hypothetical protein